jgi:hypothetical protein
MENHNESHNGHHHGHHQGGFNLKGRASALESWLAPIFGNLPHLPANWKKVITDIAPWVSLIFGILAIIGLLGTSMLGVLLSPLIALNNGIRGLGLFISILLSFATAIFSILSFKPLQAMSKKGWDYAFYGLALSALGTIISIVLMSTSFGSVIGILIGAYLLFEVRERYN